MDEICTGVQRHRWPRELASGGNASLGYTRCGQLPAEGQDRQAATMPPSIFRPSQTRALPNVCSWLRVWHHVWLSSSLAGGGRPQLLHCTVRESEALLAQSVLLLSLSPHPTVGTAAVCGHPSSCAACSLTTLEGDPRDKTHYNFPRSTNRRSMTKPSLRNQNLTSSIA